MTRAYLDQQEKVGILALGGCSLRLLDVVSLEINTLHRNAIRLRLDNVWDNKLTILVLPMCADGYLERCGDGGLQNYTVPRNKVSIRGV